MSQSELEALLGRPLTTVEVTNLNLYLDIANEWLEDLICTPLAAVTEDRIFDPRVGYRTLFAEIFTEINSITIDGETIDAAKYSPRQWDKRRAEWFNSIVFKDMLDCEEVTVNAEWGFDVYPNDLNLLIAKLFDLISKMNKGNGNVKSKDVEDFSITFKDTDVYDQFVIDNQATIHKYSLCDIQQIQHGSVRKWRW